MSSILVAFTTVYSPLTMLPVLPGLMDRAAVLEGMRDVDAEIYTALQAENWVVGVDVVESSTWILSVVAILGLFTWINIFGWYSVIGCRRAFELTRHTLSPATVRFAAFELGAQWRMIDI